MRRLLPFVLAAWVGAVPAATTDGGIAVFNLRLAATRAGESPDAIAPLLEQARFLGDLDALRRAVTIAQALPATADGWLLRARVSAAVHEFDRALRELDAAAREGADERRIRLQRAAVLAASDRAAEAHGLLGPACCADAAGLATRAIVLAHLGRHDAADRAFADALAALDTTSPFPAAWLHFARGVMWAEHAGDAARGERHYRLAVAVLPQFFLAQVHLAEIEVARGEVAAALGRLSMLAPSPANPEIDLLRGAILRRCGDEMDARSRFDAARRGYARLADELPDAFAHHREAVERAARTPAPRGGSRRPAGCTRLDRGGT